jgi:hypothetical protein
MRRPRRKDRGVSVIGVVMVLALLVVLMESTLRLYVAHADQTKKRSDRYYATQLAHSGIDWARACLAASPTASCSTTLDVGDGTIDVSVQRIKENVKVRSTGKVLRGGAERISRTETMEFGPALPTEPPASPPSPIPLPVETPPRDPGPAPAPTPDDFPNYF